MAKSLTDVVHDTQRVLAVAGTYALATDNVLVAAPGGGFRIVVVAFVMQNESNNATTMILQDGTTDKFRILGAKKGDGLAMNLSPYPLRLTENTALTMNLSGTNQCGYSVAYFVERI